MASRASSFSFTLSLLLWFCVLIAAQETTTQLPTSTPLSDGDRQATVGWVDNPKRRGTTTLLIECLTTIFACTWTVLHLNVPAITDSTTTRVLRKAKWMAITILFPEFIFAKAVCELRFALGMLDWMKRSIDRRPSDFETVSEVKIENGGSASVLWAWTVEFELVKRILYRLLLLGTPYVSFHANTSSYTPITRRVSPVYEEGKLVMEGKTFIEMSFSEKDSHFNGSAIARVQEWTLTHAYYANMGGIVARKRMKEWTSDNRESFFTHSYSVIRGGWGISHCLKELRLSADDIKDKSKADWIVKIIAVIQIARLIFDLVTRGVGGQPVTQLEIATASFSIFAIVTYLVNWWKPKDISQPTRLDTVVDQGTRGYPVERWTEPFFARLWSPTPQAPPHRYEDMMSARDRIRNDELRIGKGNSILTWVLMATSCLVFGGIHCIAWSFQFPTQVEQLAWRVAALVSTTLPVIALAGSFAILRYRPRDLKRIQIAAVEVTLDDFGLKRDINDDWWRAFTTAVSTSAWNKWIETHTSTEQDMARDMERLRWELEMLAKLGSTLLELEWPRWYGTREKESYLNTVWDIARSLKNSGSQDLALRGQYEEWIRITHASLEGNLGGQPYGGPEGVFQWFFSRCAREPDSLKSYQKAKRDFYIRAQRLSRFVNIFSGIIYTAARLVLLAIMFSSLRAVPDGVYDTANWTRFVPSFS